MSIHRTLLAASTVFLLHLTAFSQAPAPILALSEAAKLAEDAITAAEMSADCFVRSVSQVEGAAPYYRVHYQRPGSWLIGVAPTGTPDASGTPRVEDVIHVSMDGKVSFEHLNHRIRVINK